ncbi:Putative maltooligosyl trehalose synthase [Cupriavidus laharis]|uniref:Maltooligosyl trehalose synthase n=1 Tax=Cupriavidus laharis TaxID=151654 RepID=A0ABN7ZEG4_9BURK|nr:malto-oligosyltrehalose synthase [Cupriavidus laharis]CAG9182701.1 Putative maltooligosyl trehalose synthase [Cupriavidus laharis]
MAPAPADRTVAPGAPLPPRATARLQLHPGFTLADAAGVVSYYAALGVSHLYLSPVCGARPGSTHGYDVTDFTRVRDELGGETALHALAQRARDAGLGLILDIVPNHMAADPTHNAWWRDVLAHGQDNPHAAFFDIDWQPADPTLHGKVLVPMLGHPYWETLARGELCVVPAPGGDAATLRYFEHDFPLAPDSLLRHALNSPDWFDATHEAGREHLHALLERQHYRLAWWRTAATALNWRRFFEISDLVGVRQEDPAVFAATHALVFRLLREGVIDGVRVDHVDGLADPAAYCRQLRACLDEHAAPRSPAPTRPRPWLVVEKILAPGEILPADWQVDGTTGYDFMDQVSAVLHSEAGHAPLGALWRHAGGRPGSYAAALADARRQILMHHLVTEFEGATARLHACAAADPATRDLTLPALRQALAAWLEAIPVYRSYQDGASCGRDAAALRAEQAMLDKATRSARATLAPEQAAALDFIVACLRTPDAHGSAPAQIRRRVQQLMPALAAKAGEDTAFYRYGRLLSRNEVGSHPDALALSPAGFHAAMAARRQSFPHAMLATATHDHKRGEDARMRLAVLSELPQQWAVAVRAWETDGARLLALLPRVPDAADRLVLYQSLLGAWPMQRDALEQGEALAAFLQRIGQWQRKAIRETKLHGNWTQPNPGYEDACDAFLHGLAADWPHGGLLVRIGQFVQRVAPAGAMNSLAQAMIQLTAPGVPDRYQGCEDWDLSLVDPDNRRPPDYRRLQARLDCGAGWAEWLAHWRDGRVKQQLVRHVLAARRAHEMLFLEGGYQPLIAEGPLAEHVLGFARTLGGDEALTVVSRLGATLVDRELPRVPPARWGHTTVNAGTRQSGHWTDALTGQTFIAGPDGKLPMQEVLAVLPAALLLRQD